jgi:hypothetical protein
MLRRRLIRWLALAVFCVIAASWCISLALEGGWLRRSLETRLAAAFGRPVEVGRFKFAILDGPKLEADSVTVGEDPHFGQEYFLRAEQLTASMRWAALLRGRLEFDRLSLSGPSLNLVRSANGTWNYETWLPPSIKQALPHTPHYSDAQERVSQIEIDGGRINFKRGADKLPFALVDVTGYLNLQSSGRWSLDLEAHPMRAAVVLQRSGTLRLRGTVGGASARLQPASLSLSWDSASLADAARLARGTDYGLRGLLDAELAVQIDPASNDSGASPWKIDGTVGVQGIHRWDLAGRNDNPGVNLKFGATWRPRDPRLEVAHWVIEAPRSTLAGEANIRWPHGFQPELDLQQSQLSFSDVIAWVHAFSSGLAEDLTIDGTAGVEGKFAGWPLHVEDFKVKTSVAAVRSDAGKVGPLLIGPVQAAWSSSSLGSSSLLSSSLVLAPVSVRLFAAEPNRGRSRVPSEAVPEGVFHIEGALGPLRASEGLREWPYQLTLAGQTKRSEDLRAALAAAGWRYGSGWNVEGPVSLQFTATGALRSGTAVFRGSLDFRALQLWSDAVNIPISVAAAKVEFSPGERRVEIAGARALGAEWKGTLEKKGADSGWIFDLSADRLEREDIGRELGQNRRSLFYRMLPFGSSAGLAPEAQAAIARINAHGHVYLHELDLAPLRLERVDATAEIRDGGLTLRHAGADLYGGRVSGEFRVQMGTDVQYNFRGQVDRTDLSALADLTVLKSGIGGIGSGEIEFSARGIGRQALLSSLEGEGFLHIQDATIDPLNALSGADDAPVRTAPGGQFRTSSVSFRVEDGHVHVDPLLLSDRQGQLEVIGDVDFGRHLNLQVRSFSRAERLGPVEESAGADDAWIIGGTLDEPQVIREEQVTAGNRAVERAGRR